MHVRSRPISVSESAISRSVFESKALVASSCKRIRGAFSIHRAIATRCFSPPDSRRPRSPTLVSYLRGRNETIRQGTQRFETFIQKRPLNLQLNERVCSTKSSI
mmetsp:Transcript_27713/g.108702  ORF Transcript_27713/g.108702 Transcript_27713/m.108702 type:complete len:104 (+) Transcript_27713:1316-1627(+)